MKKTFSLAAFALFLFIIFAAQTTISSCTKTKTVTVIDTTVIHVHDTTTIIDTPVVCDVRGTYVGTSTASPNASTAGQSGPASYILQNDHLVVGTIPPSTAGISWGGYTNTCDSVYINVYYPVNQDYYLLKAVFTNNMTIMTGTFQNLTNTTDFGTFTMTKQ